MRIIPKKTKVSIELFKGVTVADIIIVVVATAIVSAIVASNLPFNYYIAGFFAMVFGMLLVRMDEEAIYILVLEILRHYSMQAGYQKKTVAQLKREAIEAKKVAAMSKKDRRKYAKNKKKEEKEFRAALLAGVSPQALMGEEEETPKEADINTIADIAASVQEIMDEPEAETEAEAEAETAQDEGKKKGLFGKKKTAKKSDKKAAKKTVAKSEKKIEKKTSKKSSAKPATGTKTESSAEAKERARLRKEEDRLLKDKKVSEEIKAPIRAKRKAEADELYGKMKLVEQARSRVDIEQLYKVTAIENDLIYYGKDYMGAAIEIPAVPFRFFSQFRRDKAIETALGSILRSIGQKYCANIIKIERPMLLDDYIALEFGKVEAIKRSYERGMFNEEEIQSRIEVVYDRINSLRRRNDEEKILVPHYYLVLFDSDKRQLQLQVQTAIHSLSQGEMNATRLKTKELVLLLKYMNTVDFDEREVDNIKPEDYARWTMAESVQLKPRTTQINSVITHNFRVSRYPLTVDDAWGAPLFDIPGTKIVMKCGQLDREKSIRAIDRSIAELVSQLEKTGVSSKVLELQTHIDTLSSLLVLLQNDNESLMTLNMYVTAYDIASTREDKLLVPQPPRSVLPVISSMKKTVRRMFNERGFRLNDMTFQQFQGFVGTQISGYDPMASKGIGLPSNSLAAVFPWVFAALADKKGVNLGSTEGMPTFLDFFRRDNERVNSNMVIVGKSGGGKSYATKSILTNLAADDCKIFCLDPENEYSELATNLKGKFINVANSVYGRINPFHIITSLEDDETEGGAETESSSYAAHLQFLEEFFRQILPDVNGDAMEYLNTLINRIYSRRGIDQYTDLRDIPPEGYPIFDDLYDAVLEEFQRTKSDYLKTNLRVLMNYIAKFSTGGRNASIWNGESTLSTQENFIVFNFQTLLANRNNTIANAQMLLVLKYLDNEIIKNREYNIKYGALRKIVIVIDEAHVFIDAKYPLALDFMFQLAKRIRKYNGMQIVITQNIKDFVGNEELARKSTAIINACQYSFIFGLAPNDMHDLCALYEKAGGINESEQEQIISAGRGQAFVVTGPSSRSNMQIETPKTVEEMFSHPGYVSRFFTSEEGSQAWEDMMIPCRLVRSETLNEHHVEESVREASTPKFLKGVEFTEEEDTSLEDLEEVLLMMDDDVIDAAQGVEQPVIQDTKQLSGYRDPVDIFHADDDMGGRNGEGGFTPETLQQLGFEALVTEIRRTVRQELGVEESASVAAGGYTMPAIPAMEQVHLEKVPALQNEIVDLFSDVLSQEEVTTVADELEAAEDIRDLDDFFADLYSNTSDVHTAGREMERETGGDELDRFFDSLMEETLSDLNLGDADDDNQFDDLFGDDWFSITPPAPEVADEEDDDDGDSIWDFPVAQQETSDMDDIFARLESQDLDQMMSQMESKGTANAPAQRPDDTLAVPAVMDFDSIFADAEADGENDFFAQPEPANDVDSFVAQSQAFIQPQEEPAPAPQPVAQTAVVEENLAEEEDEEGEYTLDELLARHATGVRTPAKPLTSDVAPQGDTGTAPADAVAATVAATVAAVQQDYTPATQSQGTAGLAGRGRDFAPTKPAVAEKPAVDAESAKSQTPAKPATNKSDSRPAARIAQTDGDFLDGEDFFDISLDDIMKVG